MSMEQQECYAVFHATDLYAMIAPLAERWYTERSRHYTHVADVVAPLGQVFALTNHIDQSWTENPEVVWHTPVPVRSTSVGDVIVSQQRARAWMVLPFGLQELAADQGPSAKKGGRQGDAQPSDAGEEGRS